MPPIFCRFATSLTHLNESASNFGVTERRERRKKNTDQFAPGKRLRHSGKL